MKARVSFAIACAALAATAASLAHSPLADALVADGRIAHEPWRAVTGPLVHATWWHLARDAALVLAIGIAYEQRLRGAWPWIIGAGLIAPPIAVIAGGAAGYYGLSGLADAMIAAALAHEVLSREGRAGVVFGALAVAFAAKVLVEAIAGPGAASILPRSAWLELGPHVRQAPLAHLAGAIAGAGAMISHTAFRRSRRSRSSPAPRRSPA